MCACAHVCTRMHLYMAVMYEDMQGRGPTVDALEWMEIHYYFLWSPSSLTLLSLLSFHPLNNSFLLS